MGMRQPTDYTYAEFMDHVLEIAEEYELTDSFKATGFTPESVKSLALAMWMLGESSTWRSIILRYHLRRLGELGHWDFVEGGRPS